MMLLLGVLLLTAGIMGLVVARKNWHLVAERNRLSDEVRKLTPSPVMDLRTQKLLGFIKPGDEEIRMPARNWDAMKLALWRSKVAWDIVHREVKEIVGRCKHDPGCEAKTNETGACLAGCPDREVRLSALVILNAARPFARINTSKPADTPYFAPSREHFSETIGELVAAHAELESLRGEAITAPPTDGAIPTLKEAS